MVIAMPVLTSPFILLLLTTSLGVDGQSNNCRSGEDCISQDKCPSFLLLKEQLNSAAKGTDQYSRLLNRLRGSICQKTSKLVCCARPTTTTTTTTTTSTTTTRRTTSVENFGCPARQCIPIQECENVADDYKNVRSSNAAVKAAAVRKIKGLICDKRTHSICCPLHPDDSVNVRVDQSAPTFLPGLDQGCGTTGDSQFIVGGEDTKAGEFPWAALVGTTRRYNDRTNGKLTRRVETRWGCGGILINRWFVLTAAHCQGKNRRDKITKVRLGEHTVAGTHEKGAKDDLPKEQDFTIAQDAVFVHDEYSATRRSGKKELFHDIALIKLPRPVQLNAGTKLVCLNWNPEEFRREMEVSNAISDLEGRQGVVVGWGFTTGYDPWLGDSQQDTTKYSVSSRKQQKLTVPILSSGDCEAAWATNGQTARTPLKNQVCAGGEKGKSSCKGDSGGGLYIQNKKQRDSAPWYLLGIVSLGSKFCGDGSPGIYTRVGEYIPWIRQIIAS